MNFVNAMKYATIKIFRNHKNFYFMLVIGIFSLILLMIFTYQKYMTDIHEKYLNTQLFYREISVMPSDITSDVDALFYEPIRSIPHVLDIYDSRYGIFYTESPTFKEKIYDGVITLKYGSNATFPKIVEGNIFESNATGVAICSKNFYPSSYNTKDIIGSNDIFLDGEELIGKTFKTESKIYKRVDGDIIENGKYLKEFKIIGVFDNTVSMDTPNTCYVSGGDIEDIYKHTMLEVNSDVYFPYTVLVDDKNNLGEVGNAINTMGYQADVTSIIDTEYISKLRIISIVIIIIAIISLLVTIFVYLKKNALDNSQEIGLLKAIGYKKWDIIKINMAKMIEMILIPYLLSIFIFEIIFFFIELLFKNYFLYYGYSLNHLIDAYFYTLGIIFILPIIINFIFIVKLTKKKTIVLIKEVI